MITSAMWPPSSIGVSESMVELVELVEVVFMDHV